MDGKAPPIIALGHGPFGNRQRAMGGKNLDIRIDVKFLTAGFESALVVLATRTPELMPSRHPWMAMPTTRLCYPHYPQACTLPTNEMKDRTTPYDARGSSHHG